jgi:hypothetical protein
MGIRTKLLALALLASIGPALVAQPAHAAGESNTSPAPATHEVRCRGVDCTLHIDLGDAQVPLLWRYSAPMIVDTLQKNGQLPADMALSITDDLTLALPIGNLQLLDADLQVKLDADQSVESFRGTARVPFPAIGPLTNFHVADPLHADVGFDYGANLPAIAAPLDPTARYFFFDFGSGVHLDGKIKDADGATQTVSVAARHGQRAVLAIDPLRPLVYVQGQLTISHSGGLAFVDTALAANGIGAPGFDFASLPGRTVVGVTALLSDDPTVSYLEVSTGSAIDGGALARWVGVDATPIAIDGVARIDHTGLRVTGATRSSLLPATVWDGRGQVQVFIPFEGGIGSAYVDASGAVAAPLARLNAEGASRLALSPNEAGAAAGEAEMKPSFWTQAANATGALAAHAGQGLAAAGDAATWAGDVVGAGAGAAWGATVATGRSWGVHATSGAATAWSGATCALPLVQEVLCPATDDSAVASIASR